MKVNQAVHSMKFLRRTCSARCPAITSKMTNIRLNASGREKTCSPQKTRRPRVGPHSLAVVDSWPKTVSLHTRKKATLMDFRL